MRGSITKALISCEVTAIADLRFCFRIYSCCFLVRRLMFKLRISKVTVATNLAHFSYFV